MKIAVYILAIVFSLIVVTFIFGSFLPANTYASKSFTVRASKEAVWKTLNDYPNWGNWWSSFALSNVSGKIENNNALIQISPKSGGDPAFYKITNMVKFQKLELESYFKEDNPSSKTNWTFELEELSNGTKIRVVYIQSIHSSLARAVTFWIKKDKQVETFYLGLVEKFGQ